MARGEFSGVLVFDKPHGCTSHDVVARVRRTLRMRDVGHAGTLDPMATGVLVVILGEATKLAPWLTAQDKVYETTVALGIETDTLDADGREVRRKTLSPELCQALSQSSRLLTIAPILRAALDVERHRTYQLPPVYSALRNAGQRAYAQARRGEPPTLVARPVRVAKLELTACGDRPAFCSLALEVSKGYYVRALARDLASTLGTAGHLTSLRRQRSGPFCLDEALAVHASAAEMSTQIQPLAAAAARALPVGRLTPRGSDDARHGRRVPPSAIAAPSSGPCAWLDAHGQLVAVGELDDDGAGRVIRGFSATSSAPSGGPGGQPLERP
jgi:tRNA pseudouridine55 synthase